MNSEITQFLELINPQPGYKILEVTSHADALSQAVATVLEPFDGTLDLALYPGEHETFENNAVITSSTVSSYARPFKGAARSYDIVIIRDVLDRHDFAQKILALCYRSLANAGNIIVIARSGAMDSDVMKEELEQCEFRAANGIDIFADADLVMAKKLHMWGNGL